MKFYAGIGSRKTPQDVLDEFANIAAALGKNGYTLRSGGAEGADTAFDTGTRLYTWPRRIYLPWEGFNGHKLGIVVGRHVKMREMAQRHHPAWDKLTGPAKMLHTRNVAIVLGDDVEKQHSDFVVCWTPGGMEGGGTGQALRVARHYCVPIYDFGRPSGRRAFYDAFTI